MSRTIIVSDTHGKLGLMEAALAHARFEPGVDRLITAGDFIDCGTDDVLGRAEELSATVLVGNHEVAAALGLRISPQSESSLERGDEFAERILDGRWLLAAEVEGWLVTHAGVSSSLSDITSVHGGDASAIADDLNARFADEFADAVEHKPVAWADMDRYRLLGGQGGPLWFRPLGNSLLPSGLRQIVGHTPPELLTPEGLLLLESSGWLLVDSGGHSPWRADKGHFRYAVVEDGEARVIEG